MTKYQIFTILPQISHFHKNRNFSSIFATFLDQLLHPYKFYGRDMSGILFLISASCEPLNQQDNYKCFIVGNIVSWRHRLSLLTGAAHRTLPLETIANLTTGERRMVLTNYYGDSCLIGVTARACLLGKQDSEEKNILHFLS